MHWRTRLLGVLLISMATGAALAADTGAQGDAVTDKLRDRGLVIGDEVDRIQNYRIHGFNSLDRKALIFNAGASRRYLIRLRNPCHELRSAEVIAFTDTVGNLTRKDKVVVEGAGGFVEHCLIDSLWTLETLPEEG